MNFDKVYKHIQKRCKYIKIFDSLRKEKFYHVVIQKSALETFPTNVEYIRISPLWNNEHIHLIVQWHGHKPLKNNVGIRSERILLISKANFIFNHCFNCDNDEHNFFCNFACTISSLKNICITSILKNVNYLHNLEKLNLPESLLKDIFEQSKYHCHLPEIDNQRRIKKKILESFIQQDIAFDKKFVAWLQTANNSAISNICINSHIFIVYYYFKTDEKHNICLKCMKFESKNGNYKREYYFSESYFKGFLIQHFSNWCRTCQQVPLFQVLTYDQLYNLYSIESFYEFDDIVGNKSYKEKEPIIKTDYFENNIKLKSQYFKLPRSLLSCY